MKENKYCVITYSHTNCKDVWDMYFSQLKKHAPTVNSFWMCNEDISLEKYPFCFLYDEKLSFSEQWINVLEFLEKNGYTHFIYSQEDFVLYDDINITAIHESINQIELGNTNFVKLIKSGGTEYCMQAAVHSITKFLEFYRKYQIDSIRQEGFLSRCSIGEYESKFQPESWVGNKRGMFHYDSKVWPYIATALNKGRWNLSEYKKELTTFQQEYMVDFNVRGTS